MLPSGSIPLFFRQNNPLYHSASDTTSNNYQPTSFYQLVKVLTSPCFRHTHTSRTHNTRAGKDSHNIMIVIIIMISIRLRYILKNTHKNTV